MSDEPRIIDQITDVREISVNTEASIFPGATPPSMVENPDISEFIEPTVPTLRSAKQMSLVFFFNTEEELDTVIHGMRQMIKEDSEIEMIAVLSEKTAEIRALFQEEEDIHVDAATSTIADAGAERNQDSADLES